MDYMEIDDDVVDVPDTPERLAVRNFDGRDFSRNESQSSLNNQPGTNDFPNGWGRTRPNDNTQLGSRKLLFPPSRTLSTFHKPECQGGSTGVIRNSPFSDNSLLYERIFTANGEKKNSSCSRSTDKGKASYVCETQSSACPDDRTLVDLTEQYGDAHVFGKKNMPLGARGKSRAEELGNQPIQPNRFSSLHSTSSSKIGNACKVQAKVDDTCRVGRGGVYTVESQPIAGKTSSASVYPSRRVTGQRKLVRNGCISPHNIAKKKESAKEHDHSSLPSSQAATRIVASDGPPGLVDIRDLIAEGDDSHSLKGKGVARYPFLEKEPDAKTMHLSTSSSTSRNAKANATSDPSGDGCLDGGWRSARNRTKNVNPPILDEDQHFARRKDDSFSMARSFNDYSKDQDLVSSSHLSSPSSAQTMFQFRHRLGHNKYHHAANSLSKRQKQGLTLNNYGECSTSAVDDSEIEFLGSSGEQSNARSTRNQNRDGLGDLDPIVEIDEFSPELRNSGSHHSDVMAKQVETDEMLARELQEQLYQETPGVGLSEIDEHVAFALQQEEISHQPSSSGSHREFHPRGSSISSAYRPSTSRPSQNSLLRRGSQARVPTSTRMARLRGRFPGHSRTTSGQSRTISSRARNPLFPPNVDVDMRMHILETLEAFSDMGMAGGFLQVQRDFNENDYEMLLALDENNHEHVGASVTQINRLSESTVQSEILGEECAICLETPSLGDTIRHLPCLHRFHKDCIDPWLRRKTTCPVCKSSIT